jgi:GWxTD domain-containing protein
MKHFITALLLMASVMAQSQALRDINYSFLYNPDERVSCNLKPVRMGDSWKVLYSFNLRDTSVSTTADYSIEWQGRDGLSSKEGSSVNFEVVDANRSSLKLSGSLRIPFAEAPKILVAKISSKVTRQGYLFYVNLDPNYPVNNYLISQNQINFKPYAVNQQNSFGEKDGNWVVSYYNDRFPAAAPAFSEAQARVTKAWQADSVFNLTGDTNINLFSNGLFLFQKDTLSAEGFAVRAESDYPRYSLIQNLPGPLIYICTKQEYDRLELAKGDKKAFDRTVLSITGDADRAKKLIRDYFRRVELANTYFTSYKEGWKTDRGMIYIVFGLPNEVFRFNDREVWSYSNGSFSASFDFTKSPSVFDPDNYVLIRDKKYQTTWYEVIDLWRNVRF